MSQPIASTKTEAAGRARYRRPLLHNRSDVHAIVFHCLVMAGYGLAFWLYLHPLAAGINGILSRGAFITAAVILLGWISGVDVGVNFHNHCHRPIFTRQWMNRWFGRCWTITGGWPAFFWTYAHLTVHHRRLLQDDDWTLPKRNPQGQWENFFVYCLAHWPWRYAWSFWRELRSDRCTSAIRRRAVKELAIFSVLWAIPFWIDFQMALLLWVFPQWLANVYVLAPGMYVQHAGRETPDEQHAYRHSTTFVSQLFNAIMFNIGYHAEHHTYPHVHWTELPSLHDQLKDELVADGAHVVSFGYYRAGYLVSRGRAEFADQHPAYVRPGATDDYDRVKQVKAHCYDGPSVSDKIVGNSA